MSAGRLAHVEAVAETIGRLAAGWSKEGRRAALRAAWLHDAWRSAGAAVTLGEIRAAGEEPDAWALRHAPILLHAQAAAVWARSGVGEADPEVLLAVRHHPTGHPAWGDVGRALYVADFCEPTRSFAATLRTDRLVALAAADSSSLATAAFEVLRLRLGRSIREGEPVHPDSLQTWNAWVGAREEA
ncbi:MAG TPA: hypothetical protein VEY33_14585 [Gemmatimonadota bacterium]|nr:hypothetical protein [Gemmatimonadota bacterium]